MESRRLARAALYSRPTIRSSLWTLVLGVALGASGAAAQLGGLSDEALNAFTARYGEGAGRRLVDWYATMRVQKLSPGASKRLAANDFFNQIPWIEDDVHWGLADYWATPLEMIGTNGGDCEDFSISKYFTLIEMQEPRSRLLITYVRAPALKQTHMVLAYYPTPGADPYILDNLNPKILRGSQRPDLIPVYSFNGDGLWVAVQRARGKRVGDPDTLARWRGVLDRMRQQGALGGIAQ